MDYFLPNWILVAILGGLSSNLENFLFRFILKNNDDSSAYAWFHEAFRFVTFFTISAFFIKDISSTLVEIKNNIYTLIGLGIVEFLAVFSMMKMHSYSHLSISTIISRTRLIWIPMIAFFVFQERLDIYQYLGIIILFAGLSTITSPKKVFSDRGLKYSFMFSFMVALVSIFMKLASEKVSIPNVMIFMSAPSIILFLLIMKNSKQRIANSLKVNLPLKLITGLVNVLTMFLLAKALSLGSASIVSGIYQGMMITSVLAGIFILKEKEDILKKILGSLLTVVGVLLLTAIK